MQKHIANTLSANILYIIVLLTKCV
jgi:hypothetical protein